MHAREVLCASPLFGDDLKKILPIVVENGSDSATFDNVLEFLHMAGRELPHAVLMMIPEAWSGHEMMDAERKAFYEFHGCLMEPWDGPASIAFTDGSVIGAVLDRNGLRPSRYYVTKDGLVVMASEVGVLDILPENVLIKERLHPGRIFLVDTREGRIIDDAELKKRYTGAQPYKKWLDEGLVPLASLPAPAAIPEPDHATVLARQQVFGYTHEDLRLLMAPMAAKGRRALGSMGNDAALAVLSERPRLLYDYFKQLFAQVTNPPLDAIREELVTQIETPLGPERNLLAPGPESCRLLKLKTADPRQRGIGQNSHSSNPQPHRPWARPSPRSHGQARFQGRDAANVVPGRFRRAPASRAPWTSSASRRVPPSATVRVSSFFPIAARTRTRCRSRRCSPPPACTTTWCARARA